MNPQEDTAVAETSKALTKYTAQDAHEVGLPSPAAVNFMFSVANMLYSSALVTKDMGLSKDQVTRLREFGVTGADLEERDRKAVVSNAMGKMLMGRELGIEPMAALQDVDIVKAKVFVRYPQLHRLIEDKGYTIHEMERSETMASIKLTHPTKPDRIFEFTFEDAKRAGLTKRGGYNGDSPSQYELRPRVMLWARVISEAYRATGGKGSVYTVEEKQEVMASEPESQAAPENGTQFKVGRKSAKTQDSAALVPSRADAEVGSGVGAEPAETPTSGEAIAKTAVVDPPQSRLVQTSDKPPFDPTPQTEPPLLKIVAKPVSAKPSESPTIVTVPGIPDAKVHDYLRGFLNVTKVPKTHPNMVAAVEYLSTLDPLIVLRDPYALGVDLRDWMTGKPFFGEKCSPADLRAWLRVLARGGFKLAGQFREAAMEDGQPSKIVAEWEEAGMDLSTCTQEDIESALELLAPSSPHSPEEALASAHVPNPFAGLRD